MPIQEQEEDRDSIEDCTENEEDRMKGLSTRRRRRSIRCRTKKRYGSLRRRLRLHAEGLKEGIGSMPIKKCP